MAIRVTVEDLASGETETQTIENDVLVITEGTAYVEHVTKHANGTSVWTVKGGR